MMSRNFLRVNSFLRLSRVVTLYLGMTVVTSAVFTEDVVEVESPEEGVCADESVP